MLVPSIFGENLFDDWFDADFPQWPEFRDLDRAERKLYGRHAGRLMKTDVHEHDDHYEVDIDLPGFKKEEIKLELKQKLLCWRGHKRGRCTCEVRTWCPASGASERKNTGGTGKGTDSDRRINTEV